MEKMVLHFPMLQRLLIKLDTDISSRYKGARRATSLSNTCVRDCTIATGTMATVLLSLTHADHSWSMHDDAVIGYLVIATCTSLNLSLYSLLHALL